MWAPNGVEIKDAWRMASETGAESGQQARSARQRVRPGWVHSINVARSALIERANKPASFGRIADVLKQRHACGFVEQIFLDRGVRSAEGLRCGIAKSVDSAENGGSRAVIPHERIS